MNDKELLELAAKAANIELALPANPTMRWDGADWIDWNPLTDDGDALRLAVKLDINIQHEALVEAPFPESINCGKWGYSDGTAPEWAEEPKGADPYAATRRAITRAAAEIGRAMP